MHYEKIHFKESQCFVLIKTTPCIIHGKFCLQEHVLLGIVFNQNDDSTSHVLEKFRASKKLRRDLLTLNIL